MTTEEIIANEGTVNPEPINHMIDILLGGVDSLGLKKWVKDEHPIQQGYYIVLTGNSNPHFTHTCRPAVHFWDADKKEWSSDTSYWLCDVA